MDAIADPQTGLDRQVVRDGPSAGPPADGAEAGEGGSPYLTLDGFAGPLDHLLTLARAQTIDLAGISLTALLDQLTAALRQAPAATSLGQKADWVVMAAWLVQLRTRLLLPADAPGHQDAAAEADQLRVRLVALEAMQALALWLERRPQLGHDVFGRGQPEIFGVSVEAGPAIDVTEFLWASLALFDDEAPPEAATAYRPAPLALHTVAQARERILRRLSEQPDGAPLAELLPVEAPNADDASRRALLRGSGWAATFVAGLELAKQGEVVLGQGDDFEPIHVAPVAPASAGSSG
jgi:segregation and condensation protein A